MSVTRRLLQVAALVCTLIVGAAAMAVVVAQTTWFKEWLRIFIVRQAAQYVNGRVSIGRLSGNPLSGVELEDVRIIMDDTTVVEIKDVGLDYNILTFLSGHAVLDDIRINEPIIRIEKTGNGWNIAHLIKARTPDSPRGRRPIAIGEIGVSDATVYVEGPDGPVGTSGVDVPSRIGRLDASLGITSDEDALTIDLAHVSFRADRPYLGINAMSGVVRRTDTGITLEHVSLRTEESSVSMDGVITTPERGEATIDVRASSDKFDVEELARVLPALSGYRLQPAFEIQAKGTMNRLRVDLNARDANLGNVTGDLTADLSGPDRRVAGTVSMVHFNAAPLVAANTRDGKGIKTDVTGKADIDLRGPTDAAPLRGTYVLNAGRVDVAGYEARNVSARGRIDGRTVHVNGTGAAYGGRATAVGTIVVGEALTLDLTGRAADVDLRNIPPSLRMPGLPSDLQFTYALTARAGVYSADVRLEDSTLAGAAIASGTTGQFSFGSGAPSYAAQGQVAHLDIAQVGRGLAIRALATDRFQSRVNATFELKGSGGGKYPLTLDATGTAVDSELFGAMVPRLDFTTHVAGGDARVHAAGEFAGLDPAIVTGNNRVRGALSGTMDVDTTMRGYAAGVTVDSLDAAGRVNLTRSTIGRLTVDTAAIEGAYANREGALTRLEVAGPDLHATGKGTIALNETGTSNLTAHIETPTLDLLGDLIERPLRGAAVVDGTLTGNARELKADGTLQGSNIGYGDNRALSLNSTFSVALPDLRPEAVVVDAKSTATFVEIAGQSVRQITADTSYSESKLEFNGVAQEGMRELAASGTAVIHPDHQEVHLADLALRTGQIEWRATPGSRAAIRYGTDRMAVDHLQLMSGDQRIEADGVLGSPTETLRVHAANVDVAQLDALLLGERRIAGRLDADASVSGPLTMPRAEGQFTLRQGSFRQFTFDSLAGKVDYAGRGLNIDVRMDQTPQAWIAAAGYAPLSLFRPTPAEAHGHETPGAGEGIDLRVTSSQVDLGIVEGFTSYVTNVTGAMQANVHVAGTGHDPHFDGVVDIRGGTFAVPALGTAYAGLDTRIDLKPDEVTISEMRIVDQHKKVMTVGGTLAVHERAIGAVNVKVTSDDFEVIHNQLANLRLDTDLRITGELRGPRVEGLVEVDAGTVDVARVMEEATTDPFAADTPSDPAQPVLFDALELNVGVSVPSHLVLKGNNLRPVNAPIDIGDMSVTVGGLMQIRKAPHEKMRLVGEVNTVRGSYTFQGRRFEILRDGRIRFAGTEEIDPLVDLRARRVISGVETFVRVQGSLREPELTFSSNPPQDQADILSLIVFNMPANELAEGQQIALVERAGALAGGYLVSGLTRSVANALDLDEFEIQAQGERGLGPTLSIGEQVGDRMFVRIRRGFGAEEATEFILEYQIADFLRLQTSVAETTAGTQRVTFRRVERGGLDLIFFFAY